ncbi:MAG: hypothetical protein AAGC53_07660 [Actinomycetota bacterium]
MTALALAHATATLVMAGVIWFVQIVHYPLFSAVPEASFVAYEQRHTYLTGFVVGPPMAVEGATAIALVVARPDGVPVALTVAGFAVLGIVTLSTIFIQVPLHGRLAERWDSADAQRLVRSNWIRTIGWSVRGAIAVAILAMAT